VFGNESAWGLGYALGLPWEGGDTGTVIGMAGAGGSWAGADLDRGLSLAVTKNMLTDDFDAVRRIAGVVVAGVDA
jgi:CubicO group peptidase (beta-lactamase class C family)